jgi:hypothetical protein
MANACPRFVGVFAVLAMIAGTACNDHRSAAVPASRQAAPLKGPAPAPEIVIGPDTSLSVHVSDIDVEDLVTILNHQLGSDYFVIEEEVFSGTPVPFTIDNNHLNVKDILSLIQRELGRDCVIRDGHAVILHHEVPPAVQQPSI